MSSRYLIEKLYKTETEEARDKRWRQSRERILQCIRDQDDGFYQYCDVCDDYWAADLPDLVHCPHCAHHYPKEDGECGNCYYSLRRVRKMRRGRLSPQSEGAKSG